MITSKLVLAVEMNKFNHLTLIDIFYHAEHAIPCDIVVYMCIFFAA